MKIKPKNLLGMIAAIILIFSVSTILYRNIITIVKENFNFTISTMKEKQFEIIWSSLMDLHEQAERDVNRIASNIENDIYSLSDEELMKLSEDMDNNIFNQQYHDILISNIEDYSFNGIDNHQNGVVIMNMYGYVEDFNYRRAESNQNHVHTDHNYREWNYNIETAYNKPLEIDAVDKLLNRTTGIIATEYYNLARLNDHIMINELNYNSLLEVFINEGMDGLRNYQIFVPHYITNVGDIFGTPDISHGVKLDNHKIIVVLEFNLYEQLNKEHTGNNDIDINRITYRYNSLLRGLYIFGLVSIITVVVFVLYLCHTYNDLILKEESEDIEK